MVKYEMFNSAVSSGHGSINNTFVPAVSVTSNDVIRAEI